jgi:hypothetical protein
MAKQQREPGYDPETDAAQQSEGKRAKPVHEIRLSRVKAVIWLNETENGPRHNVTLRRIFKRDSNAQWEQSDSFGRDDLPLVEAATRQAWLWIYENGHQG